MIKFLPILFFLASLRVGAQSIYTVKEGEISFYSEATLENIEAHNKNIHALLNIATRELAFIVPVRNFNFKKALMQEHFNEKYLESDKFPTATFKGKINETIDFSRDGETQATASGKLTIHGVEQSVTCPGKVLIENGEIIMHSDFNVLLKDYNITIPRVVFQNIAETIAVKINIKYTPYKK